MNCRNCGTVLNATDKFCLNCGTPAEMPAPVAPVTPLVAPSVVVENPVPIQPVVQETPVAPVAPMAPQAPMAPVAPVQPMVQPTVIDMAQPMEKGIEEYVTTGLPVGQPLPEPVETPIPVGPTLPTEVSTPVTPIPVVQEAPVSPVPVAVPAMEPVAPVIPAAPVAPMGNNVQPMPMAPKNDNKKLFIIIGGILLVTIVAVVVLFLVLGKDKEEPKDDDKKENGTTVQKPETPVTSTYQVVLGSFIINAPNDYVSRIEDSYVIFENDTYHLEVLPVEGYTIMNSTTDDIKSYLIDSGVTVTNVVEKTEGGATYFVATGYYAGVESVYIFTKSTTLYYLVGYGARLDYTYGEDIVTELISLLGDVEYSPSSNMNTSHGTSHLKPIK